MKHFLPLRLVIDLAILVFLFGALLGSFIVVTRLITSSGVPAVQQTSNL